MTADSFTDPRVRARGCRCSDIGAGLCGNEVLDEGAELMLCPRHAAAALRMIREMQDRPGVSGLLAR